MSLVFNFHHGNISTVRDRMWQKNPGSLIVWLLKYLAVPCNVAENKNVSPTNKQTFCINVTCLNWLAVQTPVHTLKRSHCNLPTMTKELSKKTREKIVYLHLPPSGAPSHLVESNWSEERWGNSLAVHWKTGQWPDESWDWKDNNAEFQQGGIGSHFF